MGAENVDDIHVVAGTDVVTNTNTTAGGPLAELFAENDGGEVPAGKSNMVARSGAGSSGGRLKRAASLYRDMPKVAVALGDWRRHFAAAVDLHNKGLNGGVQLCHGPFFLFLRPQCWAY